MAAMKYGRTGRKRKKLSLSKESGYSHQPESETIQLLQWMRKHAFKNKQLKPFEFNDTGRGLMALQCFSSGDSIVQLPRKLMITTQTVLESYLAPFIKKSTSKLSPTQVLSIYLVTERCHGKESFWFPYIQMLPKTFTTAAYFTEDDIRCLPARIRLPATEQAEQVKQAYQGIRDIVKDIVNTYPNLLGVFTYASFRWAWFVVNTRSVYMLQNKSPYLTDDEDHFALAPFLDLLNHSHNAQVEAGFNKKTNCYEIRTFTSYKKYEQVFINYGPHDNTALLLEYGFTLPVNDHNVVSFSLDDLKRICSRAPVKFCGKKMEFLKDNDLNRDLSCSLNGLSWNLQTSLRVFSCEIYDLAVWKSFVAGNGTHLNSELVNKLVKLLIEDYHTELPCTESTPATTPHTGLIMSLAKDSKQILDFILSCFEAG